MHNGWLCVERLEGRETQAAVHWLSQAFVMPLTLMTKALLGGPLGVLKPYEEDVVGSCQAVGAATQLLVSLAIVLYHVGSEIKMRRHFLANESFASISQRQSFLKWPLGSAAGLCKCLLAVSGPILVFSALWQVWLLLLSWAAREWSLGTSHMSPLLKLPYALGPSPN
eukprot:jgi/Botrbrau1/6019/Bobra.0042s0005.1